MITQKVRNFLTFSMNKTLYKLLDILLTFIDKNDMLILLKCKKGVCKMTKIYNKLVRDRIPEIIEASGAKCNTKILSHEEYIQMIDAKLDEELSEYHADQNIEELADLLELIRAAAIARGYTLEELESVRAEKAKKRGAFNDKIFLIEVEE